jgi:glutaredoxin
MRLLIRLFFRIIRRILTPFVLIMEILTKPQPIQRTATRQAELDKAASGLALYQYMACPFCVRVRQEFRRLGLNVPLRDVLREPQHRQALIQGGGLTKVPCLLIEQEDGSQRWMYESGDIIAWLRQHFED